MSTIGPIISLPWGFLLYTLIGIAILIVISEIWWKKMDHFPEDEKPYSEGNHFVIKSDMTDEEDEQ